MFDRSINIVKSYLRKHFGKQAGLGAVTIGAGLVFLPWYVSLVLIIGGWVLELVKPDFSFRSLWNR